MVILLEKINQLNMTIEHIYQLNQQNIYEFNETMKIMQQNIAAYGPSYSE